MGRKGRRKKLAGRRGGGGKAAKKILCYHGWPHSKQSETEFRSSFFESTLAGLKAEVRLIAKTFCRIIWSLY